MCAFIGIALILLYCHPHASQPPSTVHVSPDKETLKEIQGKGRNEQAFMEHLPRVRHLLDAGMTRLNETQFLPSKRGGEKMMTTP